MVTLLILLNIFPKHLCKNMCNYFDFLTTKGRICTVITEVDVTAIGRTFTGHLPGNDAHRFRFR